MLAVCLQWIYLMSVTYIWGNALAAVCRSFFGFRMKSATGFMMTGVCALTVYAQFFSLVGKVGLTADVVLTFASIVIAILLRSQLAENLRTSCNNAGKLRLWLGVFVFFVWAYLTSRGEMMFDTPLYHAQSIRWIEEYGVVKGLGNLHNRFAYNSSVFSLFALFSMRFLNSGIPLHAINGFFAFLLSLLLLNPLNERRRKEIGLSFFARIASFYYLMTIVDEVVGPSSDYATMCVIFFIVTAWLDLIERGEKDSVPYGLLCVLGVYALTLKLTAGLILVLTLKPAVQMVRKRHWKEITFFLLLGIVVAMPWMIRSVIISGWLLYPFPKLDLFRVDWKMPAGFVQYDADEIKVWGRALYRVDLLGTPVTEWFGNWFSSTLQRTEKLLICIDLGSLLILLVILLRTLIGKVKERADECLVLAVVAFCYLYWQLSAPLMRYGYAYVLLLAFLTAGFLATGTVGKKYLPRLAVFGGACLIVYKTVWLGTYVYKKLPAPYYIQQQDYETFEVTSQKLEGITVYTALPGGMCGYYDFPAVPDIHVKLRGNGLKDGFSDARGQ